MSLVSHDLRIEPVETSRQKKAFLQFPWEHYRGDPHWIPPLRQNQKELVNFAHNPFYDRARIQTFLARQGARIVGRIAAIVNDVHNERFHEKRGFFGFFESIDSQEVASGLLGTARDWVAAQGMDKLRGPQNPSLNYEAGTLVDGFFERPTFMMTYNHAYYDRLIQQAGFAQAQDMYAYWGHVDMLAGVDKKLQFVNDEAIRRFNIKLRRLNRKKFKQEVKMFLHIYNESLHSMWGFTPLSDGEMEHLSAAMQWLIVPELTTIAEIDGRPVAVAFALLDYNPRIKLIDGRLFPLGLFRLLWQRKSIKRMRLVTTNVLPEYQMWGLGLVVLANLVPTVLKWGIQDAEFSWVMESNRLSLKSLERGGAKRTKTYRIYDYAPWENAPAAPSLSVGAGGD